jgi:hypothetical protein
LDPFQHRHDVEFDCCGLPGINNPLNSENTIGATPATTAVPVAINGASSTDLAATTLAGDDLLTLVPGRSIMFIVNSYSATET